MQVWLKGALAAFIGGAAGAISNGLTLPVLDAETFNWLSSYNAWKMVQAILFNAGVGGLLMLAGYLKQSPVWK